MPQPVLRYIASQHTPEVNEQGNPGLYWHPDRNVAIINPVNVKLFCALFALFGYQFVEVDAEWWQEYAARDLQRIAAAAAFAPLAPYTGRQQ